MMKIAIVGGGIGGLIAALFLERLGLDVHVYEQAPQIRPLGAGIILAHNAMQIFRTVDLYSELLSQGNILTSTNITTPSLSVIQSLKTHYFDEMFDVHMIAISRGLLQMSLQKKIPDECLHLNYKLNDLMIENNKVRLAFESGEHLLFDAVIAADGINSSVRKILFKGENTIRQAQQICWRGIANYNLPEPLNL